MKEFMQWFGLAVVAIFVGSLLGYEVYAAKTRLHSFRVHRDVLVGNTKIYAICDEFTGTMLYVAMNDRYVNNSPVIAAVPNSCRGER